MTMNSICYSSRFVDPLIAMSKETNTTNTSMSMDRTALLSIIAYKLPLEGVEMAERLSDHLGQA